METSFLSTPAPIDTMAHSSPPTFLKLEDLDASSPQSTPPTLTADGTPAPIIVHSKAAKKRKSWGQELPEPTTNLPPRKRAKTTEEKEQRRIERIKRNRAAAHNSRERKRQETETLAVQLARAQSVIDAYRKLYGSLPADVVLPEVAVCIDEADTPAPSLVESRGSLDINGSPATTTADDLYEGNTITIKQEPTETTFSASLPPTFEGIDSKQGAGTLAFFDLTQHSAAMLCDLQCRSSNKSAQSPASTSAHWWAAFLLYLMTLNLQASSQTLLLAFWTHFPTQTARLISHSMRRLTSRTPPTSLSMTSSTTPLRSRPTRAQAQLNAATARVSSRQQRQELVQVYLRARARALAAAARRGHQNGHVKNGLALQDSGRDTDVGINDDDGGVGS